MSMKFRIDVTFSERVAEVPKPERYEEPTNAQQFINEDVIEKHGSPLITYSKEPKVAEG